MNGMNISWRDFRIFWPEITSVIKLFLVIVMLDLTISISASFFISDSFSFKKYVDETRYRELINKHYSNKHIVVSDAEIGWVNKPSFEPEFPEWWKTGPYGSRISKRESVRADGAEPFRGDDLVFLLGSSAINGHSLAFKDAPISHLKRYGHSVYDFSSIMYSVDQSFALYKSRLSEYEPKVLIVGIHNTPKMISNMFPVFSTNNFTTPFLKPAYYLSNNKLVKVPPPTQYQRSNDFVNMLADLKEGDINYYHFQFYQRLNLLPFSNVLRGIILWVDKELYGFDEYIKAVELQRHIMKELVRTAKNNGTEVIFVKFEKLTDIEKPWYKYLYKDKNTVHTELLEDTPMNILYLSAVFKEANVPTAEFFLDGDEIHLSSLGSEILALKINQTIKNIEN